MRESKQQHLRRGIRLTETAPLAKSRPLAGAIPIEQFLSVAEGPVPVKPIAEPPSAFAYPVDFGGLNLTALLTSGFEGIELPELDAQPVVEESAPAVETEPRTSEPPPAIIVPKNAAPVLADYEPMEFLDFDEPEFEFTPEPEPEPPAMATEPLAVPVRFCSPATAKLMQGATDVPMPSAPVHLPKIQLRTLRRKMALGADPNKPAPKPQPATPAPAAPAPKPAPQVIGRPASSMKQPQKPPAAAKTVAETPKPAPVIQEKPKVTVRPGEPVRQAPVAPSKPAIAARDRGNAVPVQRESDPEPVVAPAPKPKLMPIRKPDAVPAAAEPMPMLGMAAAVEGAGMSASVKAAIAVVGALVIGGGAYFGFSGSTKANSSGPSESISGITSPGMVMGGGGWTSTWGSDAPINKGKQIAIFRPSMAMTDYRFEFKGQIERKALGWVFRAADPKNYYVMKLETIKPGANPIVALIKYAVVNGKETTRTQVMLPFEVALDTLYHVRFEANGDKFTTYVQNKLVDYWTDDRIKVGGTGFYNDNNERGQIKSSQISYLIAGK